jgi:shikimate dehydrogenase
VIRSAEQDSSHSSTRKTRARAELVVWDRTYRVPEASDIVVNATSVGLFPNVEARLDLDADSLRPSMVVADVIPNPPRTPLIRDAEARGCNVLDGLGMLVNQGVISIRHWIGIDADPTVMRQKLEDLFGVPFGEHAAALAIPSTAPLGRAK